MGTFNQQLSQKLADIEKQGHLREVVPVRHLDSGYLEINNTTYLNLAGNDYLGLATDKNLIHEFYNTLEPGNQLELFGPGSTASRLMTGNTTPYSRLESHLQSLYNTEAALVFNSGYHLNIGILPAVATRNDLILADKLCHASLIDGMRLSRAKVIRYPHLDYPALEKLLKKERNNYQQVFIVTESIFSMDGDTADLSLLANLKNTYNGVLYVDEAHGVGIRGENGLGLAEEQGCLGEIEIFTGTFGKAYGGQGAFTVCNRLLADYLVNSARSQIFTTGLPPVAVHWLCFVLQRISSMKDERLSVKDLARQLRAALRSKGLATHGSSNIVPVMIGDAALAVQTAKSICEQGYWVKAVRPPTVPTGTSRLRLSLNAAMQWSQLAPLPELIARQL